jgi:ATP-dependent DNA helicase RecG
MVFSTSLSLKKADLNIININGNSIFTLVQNKLATAIEYLKGVGPAKADTLKRELRIYRYWDLLHLFPFRYVDRSRFYKISEITNASTEIQLVGKILRFEEVAGKGRNKRLVAFFSDGTDSCELVWFQGGQFIKKSLKTNVPYVLFGKPNFFKGSFSFPHPELELLSDFKANPIIGLQPIYPSSEKLGRKSLDTKGLSKLQRQLIPQVSEELQEIYSDNFLAEQQLITRKEAYIAIHFPKNLTQLEAAQKRIKFDEFFFLQLSLIRQKHEHQRKYRGFPFASVGDRFNHFYTHTLPFELTGAQKRVLKEIRRDVAQGAHMNRLVQGDVGSGKTIVALMSMLLAIDNGFQTCLMAPTEILATQHFKGIQELLEGSGLSVELLTGSVKMAQRKTIHAGLEDGSLHILIGTHALIEDKVRFKNLGLAVVDEQHRFGVAQRAKLWQKNSLPPHVLVMTATPIPRTLAMAVYGDLDISVIDELPPGRKPIETVHQTDANRLRVFGFMKEEINKGRQVYVVYPLIEESETMLSS